MQKISPPLSRPIYRSDIVFSFAMMIALSSYQLALCFFNTRGLPVTNGIVAATEGALLGLIALKLTRTLSVNELVVPFLFLAYFMLLWVLRGEAELQGVRNLVVIFLCFHLGCQMRDISAANLIVLTLCAIVIGFGLWEYAAIDSYLALFDIKSYYAVRGLVTEEQLSYLSNNLFVSGLRPFGRTILPALGDQRVSSVFLEPVSMGNFAVIIAMWALSFDKKDWRKSLPHYVAAMLFIIASDSRFASVIIGLLVVIRLLPALQRPLWYYPLPVIAAGGLAYIAYAHLADPGQDNLAGRLAKSGEALLEMPLNTIFGLADTAGYYDMGIPFALGVFGLPACIVLWLCLLGIPFKTLQGRVFASQLPVYCIGLLTISGTSFFSAKTAGLLWFLLGYLHAQKNAAHKV